MKIRINFLILSLVATCYSEKFPSQRNVRAPQGHVQYSEPDGNKVNWKLYAPYTQWKSNPQTSSRSQRAESFEAQPTQQSRIIKQEAQVPAIPKLQYKPYAMLPSHIKQLIYHMYQPQLPYVDPAAYVYQTYSNNNNKDDETQEDSYEDQYARTKSKYGYAQEKKYKQGHIQYKQDYQPKYLVQHQPAASEQSQQINSGMPNEIQQLLYLQAQIPYHVIANRILYQPKAMFIPKPIPIDEKNPYKYHTKIYYLKDGTLEPEETMKSVNENQRQY